ncbi:stearoyl-CoA desaturase 5-like isoform X1 [Haliotis rubra]|uniref:stearoyl-CoA desaturase 5-like isoform X1 n=2 Tax=Haliotis rubra TaxID=36100 RepID=UPI001EE564E0|nr:stearoyl-CoA desaturase 5-like isoform X1 [Haliotis rubra]
MDSSFHVMRSHQQTMIKLLTPRMCVGNCHPVAPHQENVSMAPKNVIMETTPSEDMLTGSSEVEPVITAETHAQKRPPMKIVWRNVVLFALLHLAAVYSLLLVPQAHSYTLLWCAFMYLFAALGITAGAHRLWAHRSYKAKMPLRILLAIMDSAAFQNSVFEWSRDHRCHHKYSETDADPHNAKRGFFFSHMGWLMVKKHPDVIAKGKQLEMADLKADPVVRVQEKFYVPSVLLFCFIVPSVVPWYFWGEGLFVSFYLAAILRYCLGLNATWLVNSAAHMWGMRPYDKRINPAENMMVALSAVGEGFHNYHHTFPQDYATSEFGWKINLTTFFIDTMAYLGLAYDRRKIPDDVIRARKLRTGEGSP